MWVPCVEGEQVGGPRSVITLGSDETTVDLGQFLNTLIENSGDRKGLV